MRTLDKDKNNFLTISELKTGLSAHFAEIVRSVERVVGLVGEDKDKGRVALANIDRLANWLERKQEEEVSMEEGDERIMKMMDEDEEYEDDDRRFYRIVDHVPSNCATGLVDEQGNCRTPWGSM